MCQAACETKCLQGRPCEGGMLDRAESKANSRGGCNCSTGKERTQQKYGGRGGEPSALDRKLRVSQLGCGCQILMGSPAAAHPGRGGALHSTVHCPHRGRGMRQAGLGTLEKWLTNRPRSLRVCQVFQVCRNESNFEEVTQCSGGLLCNWLPVTGSVQITNDWSKP